MNVQIVITPPLISLTSADIRKYILNFDLTSALFASIARIGKTLLLRIRELICPQNGWRRWGFKVTHCCPKKSFYHTPFPAHHTVDFLFRMERTKTLMLFWFFMNIQNTNHSFRFGMKCQWEIGKCWSYNFSNKKIADCCQNIPPRHRIWGIFISPHQSLFWVKKPSSHHSL